MKIILASGSPRRRELLSELGYEFEVVVSDADENIGKMEAVKMVEELSYVKAAAVAEKIAEERPAGEYLIIGADTIVVHDGEILGKPADKNHAYEMIRELSAKTHQVYTGVAFLTVIKGKIKLEKKIHDRTDVLIREMSEAEIADYIENTDDWKDKAGGYGIQTSFGARYIPEIHGDYYNVVGLPACKVGQCISEIFS